RDDVAGAGAGGGGQAADRVAGGAGTELDAVTAVGDGGGASSIRADEVAGHQVVVRSRAADLHAVGGVARGHIARAGGGAADGVAGGAEVDDHAGAVGERGGAGGVGTDPVAHHQVARR